MGRTLEIQINYCEHQLYVGQIKNLSMADVKNINFFELASEQSSLDYKQSSEAFIAQDGCHLCKISIKNGDKFELEKDIDLYIDKDIKKEKHNLLYWGEEVKGNSDTKLFTLDKNLISYIGYISSKASLTARYENFVGEFDIKKLTAIINSSPSSQCEFFPEKGKFLTDIYYGNTKMDFEYDSTSGSHFDTVEYFDKNWNSTTPILYLKHMPDTLK